MIAFLLATSKVRDVTKYFGFGGCDVRKLINNCIINNLSQFIHNLLITGLVESLDQSWFFSHNYLSLVERKEHAKKLKKKLQKNMPVFL